MDFSLYFIFLAQFCIFILVNIMPCIGAYKAAGYCCRDGLFERLLTASAIWLIELLFSFTIPGLLGCLNAYTCLISGSFIGGILYFRFRHLSPEIKVCHQPLSRAECFMVYILGGLLLYRLTCGISLHSGTDTFLYHFYFPAVWVQQGKIMPISLPGLPHEYFPVCGELLYGWFFFPLGNGDIAPIFPNLCCLFSVIALFALGKVFRFHRFAVFSGCCLLLSTSILAEYSVMGYTEVINGALLLASVSLLLIGVQRNRLIYAVLAGVVAGCSTSVKYIGLMLTPVAFLLLLLPYLLKNFSRNRRFVCTAAVTACITAGCFYLPNWIRTGNPFYPVPIPGIFPNGFSFERGNIPFRDLWSFYVGNDIWKMNWYSALIYGVLPLVSLLLYFIRKSEHQERTRLFTWYAVMVLVESGLLLFLYPPTGARQIIPLLMLASPLLIYVLDRFHGIPGYERWVGGFTVLSCPVLLWAGGAVKLLFSCGFILFLFLILFRFQKKQFMRKFIYAFMILSVILLPLGISFYYMTKQEIQKIYLGQESQMVLRILRMDYKQFGPSNIASIGFIYNALLMDDMPANRIKDIPINRKGSVHPHDFTEIRELREPVSPDIWLERLHREKIRWLVIDTNSHAYYLFNRDQELKWAKQNPAHFQPLLESNGIALFQVR